MYNHIYVPVDNSDHSNRAIDVALELAKAFGAQITGSHAYAAKLHDVRFKQMEFTLPEEYQEEKELEKQRKIHDSLITMGLRLISDSYLDLLEKRCQESQIPFTRKMQDGKNWQIITQEIQELVPDLVVLGALGTGAVKHSQIGSVCERVLRRTRKDTLVIKDTRPFSEQTGPIVVAVDGSPQSFAGVKVGLELARKTSRPLEVVSVYDPYLHYTVFNGIVSVLSEKASKIFRFKEQEQLHEDIIDTGLAKIYQSHLEVSSELAQQAGVPIKTHLKAGKAFEKVFEFTATTKPFLLILGRIGVHSGEEMDIGSNAENILRLVSCNVLLISQKFVPPIDLKADSSMVWTEEAKKRFERVPEQVRKIARTAVHRYAMERGHSIITNSIIDTCMELFMPKTAQKMEDLALELALNKIEDPSPLTPHPSLVYICSICGKVARGLRPVVCTVCRAPAEKFELLKPQDIETLAQKEGGLTEEITFDGVKLKWTQEAKTEFIRIQDGYLRRRALAQLEKAARMRGLSVISKELMSEFVGRVMSDKENPIQVTPHVAVENEVASPLPLPQKWEKMSSPSTLEQLGNFQWTEEALSRLSRVPSGFMRDNTRLKIEEYAKEKGIVNINLEVAEAGIARARELMAEMISGYSSGKK